MGLPERRRIPNALETPVMRDPAEDVRAISQRVSELRRGGNIPDGLAVMQIITEVQGGDPADRALERIQRARDQKP